MIDVKDLSFKYIRSESYILNRLSFSIKDGTTIAILGKNGIGKTTFLKCLTAEITDYSGSILIDGHDVRKLSISELSKLIAVVASNNPCYQNLCVADYLVIGLANQLATFQFPNKAHYEKAFDVLAELKQEELLNRSIYELSSGEMQIVKIARAILQNPKIIVFDEPTSNLDIKNQLLVLNHITSLAQRGYTVITTTHNPGQAMELAGKVLMLSTDEYVFGSTEEILTEDNLKRVYDLKATINVGKYRKYTIFEDESGAHKLIC